MDHPNIPQSIALETKYIPASNTRCAKVRVSCKRLGLNKAFSYDYSARGAYEQIEKALIDSGIMPSCVLDMGKTYVLVIPWSYREQVEALLSK